MLTCKEISALASKRLDEKLTLPQRIEFFIHTMMCTLCRNYAKDIQTLHNIVTNTHQAGKELLPEHVKLSDKARERIQKVIENTLKQ
ncbi:MAG: hypothetical protein KAG19_00245 [Methylococcales bacterium]|nr:hypothetical protein [Methylococcales bacterium]